MFSDTKKTNIVQFLFHWTARGLSVLTTLVLLLFLFGEPFPAARLSAREWTGLLFFPFGILLGFAVAWWKEAVGATITILSLAAFYLVYGLLLNGKVGWLFIVFAVPGFLFLISAMLSRRQQTSTVHA
ncbi:MAG TPA: hypothetical protein VNG94_07070 [Pyrinomonadaceae bacterium]|nr:hypothetical protein [Pyrinomonadaceae bacterium]